MWSFGSCASSKILRGRFRLILKVMTSFAHQVLVFTPWFVITFVTLPGKCQWFCRCALPPGVSGSSRDTSCKRKCSSSEADHKGDVVIEPWERGVADVADKEDAVIRLQDIKLLKIIHYPPGRIFQMSGIKHVNQFPHKNFLPWVCWNHGWDNGAVPFLCPPSITKIIIFLENSTIPPWKCMEQTGESGQQHLEDPPVESTHHTTVHLWWEFTLVTIFKSSPSPCILEYAGANLNCVPFPSKYSTSMFFNPIPTHLSALLVAAFRSLPTIFQVFHLSCQPAKGFISCADSSLHFLSGLHWVSELNLQCFPPCSKIHLGGC